MTCTLKEHYNKAHGMQLTTSELNKVCVKLPPGPINPPITSPIPHTEQQQPQQQQIPTQQMIQTHQDTSHISLLNIPGIQENVVQQSMMTNISSPVNLAK